MEALRKGNTIRSKRAQLKQEIKAGHTSVDRYLADPPEWLKTMKVFDLLTAVPKYGKSKSAKVLKVCRISSVKTIGGMSKRQRKEIISLMRR